jgi:hypothetical protein
MVSSEAKNGFNCVSCGTHRRWTSQTACHSPKTRTPPSVWEGRGLGNPPEGDILRSTAFKAQIGSPKVPHGTSGTSLTGHTFLEASGALTVRGTKKMPRLWGRRRGTLAGGWSVGLDQPSQFRHCWLTRTLQKVALFWTTTCIFWTAVYVDLCLG